MYLSSFSYNGTSWKLEGIRFQQQSFIVGPNSVGKTRTLNRLYSVLCIIAGNEPEYTEDIEFLCELVFEDDVRTLAYSFGKKSNRVIMERLSISGNIIIERTEDVAQLNGSDVNPPASTLVLHSQRDIIKYPIFEELISWAGAVKGFVFSNILTESVMPNPFRGIGDSVSLANMYVPLENEQKKRIVRNLNELGYKIKNIGVVGIKQNNPFLVIAEDGVHVPVLTNTMSNGLARIFVLLLFLESVSQKSNTSCLLVDDLGEGLDYERTVKLGRILFKHCEDNQIQLIVTSNDNFLMDVIDLKKWNLLSRKGSVVSSLDYHDNPSLFDDFVKTGLNNFDFLSSSYRLTRDAK